MNNKTYHQIFWAAFMLFWLFSSVICGFMTLGFATHDSNWAWMFAVLFSYCGWMSFVCNNKWILVDTKFDKTIN